MEGQKAILPENLIRWKHSRYLPSLPTKSHILSIRPSSNFAPTREMPSQTPAGIIILAFSITFVWYLSNRIYQPLHFSMGWGFKQVSYLLVISVLLENSPSLTVVLQGLNEIIVVKDLVHWLAHFACSINLTAVVRLTDNLYIHMSLPFTDWGVPKWALI